ncbi:hypothetical protein SPRG_08222 [Saprolegnia parasitica CBS 223.65]|uniref:RPA-interacting protein N-terminal domain-containing protein n=1 Tax=Saprolegnia parasitica (strain CBS 223.65) TaxID=695850 RepID=A0A067C6L0_SAPPC|nr:hypothetical protein SPRG_08222 [Saprolegnia parasitica CBS 223.65]KDO26419.1 hypothetical protein SPRG_08222 [Saprolegnia parasitica CBS 223.65]|eukprot:XP_012202856.1 hypothetical protein SPRG_08222 [Saprolegnia parasitica CBS 223.65]
MMAGVRGKQRWAAQGRDVTFMSPMGLKERIKKRCMDHMKKHRKRILDNLRNCFSDVAAEVMDVSEVNAMDELLVNGELSQDDYLDILMSLEAALRDEVTHEDIIQAEAALAEEEAWIADFEDLDLCQQAEFVLCPICKSRVLTKPSTGPKTSRRALCPVGAAFTCLSPPTPRRRPCPSSNAP